MLRNNLFAHLAKYLAHTKVITLNDCYSIPVCKKFCRNLYDIFVTGMNVELPCVYHISHYTFIKLMEQKWENISFSSHEMPHLQ